MILPRDRGVCREHGEMSDTSSCSSQSLYAEISHGTLVLPGMSNSGRDVNEVFFVILAMPDMSCHYLPTISVAFAQDVFCVAVVSSSCTTVGRTTVGQNEEKWEFAVCCLLMRLLIVGWWW